MTSTIPINRLGEYFAGRTSRQAWVARRLLKRPDPGDNALKGHLTAAVIGSIRPDGSLAGGFLPTALAIRDLVELGAAESVVARPLQWVINLQGKPGAFHEGCTAARHPHRVCEHFLGGFFAPAPPTLRVAPVTVPNGKVFRVESQARFALSCIALEAVVLGGRRAEAQVSRHLESFVHLVPEWAEWSDFLAPDLAFAALGPLSVAPERFAQTAEKLVEIAAANQQPDGTWPRAEFFAGLEALASTRSPAVVPILERAIPALLQRQRDDGSFGSVSQDERALIGLRVLLRLQEPL